ncbi:hypothetical protein LZK77_16430 [Rhizobium leguminosarum]|nr:hypothetical protein LZK77_16430 [Rhizobium leguminosarum]
MAKKKKDQYVGDGSPAERANRVKVLFERWVEEGLPKEVELPLGRKNSKVHDGKSLGLITMPTSLNQVLLWTAPEFGLHKAIGSKRYVSLSDAEYGSTAQAILAAINALKKAKKAKRPPPKTEKAKRVAAVALAKRYMNLAVGLSKQLHEQGERLNATERDLIVERGRNELLSDDLAQAQRENAALKKMLDRKRGKLRVVD